MHNFSSTFLLIFIISLVSCKENKETIPSAEKEISTLNPAIEFRESAVILVYPDQNTSDSLKKMLGHNEYYKRADQAGGYYSELRNILKKKGITVVSAENQHYRFVSSSGTITEINLSEAESPWQVILFNRNDSPWVVPPEKAKNRIDHLFPSEEKTVKTNRQPFSLKKSSEITETVAETPVRDQNFANTFQTDTREITIRLLIPPGQSPVSDRRETNSIRIINSFISPANRIWLKFDNDIFSNTDRYYTNGIELGFTSPGVVNWPLNYLMISFNRNSVVQASLSLHHAMFTPFTTKTPPVLQDERPYASTLFMRYSQTCDDGLSGLRLTSSIDAGVIGDAALGRYFQKSVHASVPTNDEPLGWETQIKNDLILNYSINLQKQMFKSRFTEILSQGTVSAGTLYTWAGMGIDITAGKFSSSITPLPLNYNELRQNKIKLQYGIRGGIEFRATAYNATLQGGLINKKNIYALKPNEIERVGANLHLGIFARHGKLNLSIAQFYQSREFKEGHQHFWGQIGLEYNW